MGFFDLSRVPEPEVMDDSAEVEAYSSAAAQAYLDQIDDTFVEHVLRLVRGRERGLALDIGSGPGQIVIKLAKRLTGWQFIGAERSPNMVEVANGHRAAAGDELTRRVVFQVADGNRLLFPEGGFDLVMCNSVLHHLAEPKNMLDEMARVAKPGGAILLRDLRRPGRLAYGLHVRWHGRYYSGTMRKLYRDSVRAAYTPSELQRLLEGSALRGAHVFAHGATHIGLERAAAAG
jgi:ubiquinone/menaquinone biosynthesis C-methylase UbiE